MILCTLTLFKVTVVQLSTTKEHFVELILYCYCSCQFVKKVIDTSKVFLDWFNNR